MNGLRTLSVGALVTVLVACGSDSDTNGGGSTGGGGGGAGGTGATSGGGGSGGQAGSTSGGSGGAPGGTGGVGGSGGVAGSAGTGAVAGTGGSGGSGGTGGTANPGCEPLCNAIVAANCNSGPTQAGCLLTCKTLTSSASCDSSADAYFACVNDKGVQCNAAGEPVSPGCGIEWLKAIDCAVTESPNPAMVAPCATYCDKVVAANCPNNGTLAECNSNCKWLGATGTGCDDEWGSYLTCANAANFICVVGFAAAQGCGQAFTAYTKCVDAAGNP